MGVIVVIIYVLSGGCGVGKRTIGKTLSERLGLFLFHNHLTANIARGIYHDYGENDFRKYSRFVVKLRKIVIMEAFKSNSKGIVITHANHERRGPNYALQLNSFCKNKGICVNFINLSCDESERCKRFTNKERKTSDKSFDKKTFQKINRDWGIPTSLDPTILPVLLDIDVTNLSSDQVVDEILKIIASS